jgi:hypothetical protein
MGDPVITNNDVGGVTRRAGRYEDNALVFAGAVTVLAGTILARDSVSLKLVLFVIGGSTNENGIPKAVVDYPVTAAGAGDEQIRALVEGEVQAERLVVDADGDASNLTKAHWDMLRNYGIVVVSAQDLSYLDNQ